MVEGRARSQRTWTKQVEFQVASEPGNERQAMEKVKESVDGLGLEARQLERLGTAVSEATMNAMEHGNKYNADTPVTIEVFSSDEALAVRITDQGGGLPIPDAETPDLEAKLDGGQSPRGWGLFLIENMVDEMNVNSDQLHHTIELIMHLKGEA